MEKGDPITIKGKDYEVVKDINEFYLQVKSVDQSFLEDISGMTYYITKTKGDMKIPNHMIEETIKEAQKSEHKYLIGAVIFKKNSIISRGHNYSNKAAKHLHPRFQNWKNSIHAEHDAILKARTNLKGLGMLVLRINNKGELKIAKPCEYCQSYINHVGIKDVYYSNANGDLEELV